MDLTHLIRFVWIHLLICALLAVAAGAFLLNAATGSIYGSIGYYMLPALLLACGPILAAFLSTVLLALLICRRGPRGHHLLISLLCYVMLTIMVYMLGMGAAI